MFLYLLKDLFRRTLFHGTRIAGLLVICVGLTTFVAMAQSIEISSMAEVSEHWRGTYDLLVRAKSSVSETEKELGIVNGNFMGMPQGGITISQLDVVRNIAGVEIAAPVAPVGYLLNQTGTVGVEIMPIEPGTLYQAEIDIQASERDQQYSRSFFGLQDLSDTGSHLSVNFSSSVTMGDELFQARAAPLPPLWTMLAGVDPEAEAALAGLNRSITQGQYLLGGQSLRETVISDRSNPWDKLKAMTIPIIVSQRSYIRGQFNASISIMTITPDAWDRLFALEAAGSYEELVEALEVIFDDGPAELLHEYSADWDSLLKPLSGYSATLKSDGQILVSESGSHTMRYSDLLIHPGQVTYISCPAPPGHVGLSLCVTSLGTWGETTGLELASNMPEGYGLEQQDVPAESAMYRPLTVLKPAPFAFDVIGTYSIDRLEFSREPLSYVPMGIYETPIDILRYSPEGVKVDPIEVRPSLNPGDFLMRPPLALTTLEGAEYLSGRDDFISAIRVRVAGIEGYSPEEVSRIEQIASEIAERTGLDVAIVAGSSPQSVLIKVPEIGYVEEAWTTLGAALSVTHGINFANLLLLSCFVTCALLFLSNASTLSIVGRSKEIALLRAFGWQDRTVLSWYVGEALLVGVVAAFVTVGLSRAAVFALDIHLSWPSIVIVSSAAIVMYVLSTIKPIYKAVKRPIVEGLSKGEVEWGEIISKLGFGLRGMLDVVVRNLGRRKSRTIIQIIMLALGVALAAAVIQILIQLNGRLEITFLGQQIRWTIRSYQVLMVVCVLIMAVLANLEAQNLNIAERAWEFALLRATGWKKRHIFKMVTWEGISIGCIGGLIGGVLGLILAVVISGLSQGMLLIPLVSLVASIGLGIVIGVIPAMRISQFDILHLLGNQVMGISKKSDIRPSSFAWLGGTIAVFMVAALVFISRPDVIETVTQAVIGRETYHHAAYETTAKLKPMQHVQRLADMEPRNLGNQAEQAAVSYVANLFANNGLLVERITFPISGFRVISSDSGEEILSSSQIGGSVSAMAYQGEAFEEGPFQAPFVVLRAGNDYPAASELEGKIPVVVDQEGALWGEELRSLVAYYGNEIPFQAGFSLWGVDETGLGQLEDGGIVGETLLGTDVVGTILGNERPEQEIWVVTRLDSPLEGGGADASASGLAVVLELAKIYQNQGSLITLRFIALGGMENGLEGLISYWESREVDPENIIAVLVLEQLGSWDRLIAGVDLASPGPDGYILPEEIQTDAMQSGLSWMEPLLVRRFNLESGSIEDWQRSIREYDYGPRQSPPDILDIAAQAASDLDIDFSLRFGSCDPSILPFLYWRLPSVIICGEGNGVIGSPFDTIDTLDSGKLKTALAFSYHLIELLGGRNGTIHTD